MTKAEIQYVRSLADKRMRDSEGVFIAEGDKLVEEIVASELRIRNLYTTHKGSQLRGATLVERSEMERISQLKSANTTLAVVEQPRYKLDERALKDSLVLALDGVQNPGNMGTIIRLADWFGVSDVICSMDTVDVYNPKTIASTMGSIARVRVHYVDLEATLSRCPVPVYGTFLNGENVYEKSLPMGAVMVIGNEAHGISPSIEALCHNRITIPRFGDSRTESLNAAMATAILLGLWRR